VLEGFFDAIQCSLSYVLTNTDKEQGNPPLLECKLELQSPDMVFNPSLEQVVIAELGACASSMFLLRL